ncbi:hypothetical protein [Sphingomonas azotifigens]|uniref:hypothetical protein n=1 Tax=Sphingomonas azotifigens TaxID=330920 RepID=UPI000A02BB29|nr:hypothetical protein [Sphingomonas azotifigens]
MTPDILLLGSAFDPVLVAVAEMLGARSTTLSIRHARLEDLAAAHWCHRVGSDGAETEVRDGAGRALRGARTAVLNRLRYEPALLFTRMTMADRDYARAEFHALLMSWLAGPTDCCINAATASGLAGPALRPWQWLAAAQAAGLAVAPARTGSSTRRRRHAAGEGRLPGMVERRDLVPLFADPAWDAGGLNRPYGEAAVPDEVIRIEVVGGIAHPPPESAHVPTSLSSAAGRLAQSVGADILAVELGRFGNADWRFMAADPMPPQLGLGSITGIADRLLRSVGDCSTALEVVGTEGSQ